MRKSAREAAFKIVFANLFHDGNGTNFRAAVYKQEKLEEDDREFAERLVALVSEHKDELLSLIDQRVERFAEYRIYAVDKALLLVSLAEIKYFDDIPPVVSVSEATALAKKYSTEKSTDFVNGVLGGFINS